MAVDWRECAWSPPIVVQSGRDGVSGGPPLLNPAVPRPAVAAVVRNGKTAKAVLMRPPRAAKPLSPSTLFSSNP